MYNYVYVFTIPSRNGLLSDCSVWEEVLSNIFIKAVDGTKKMLVGTEIWKNKNEETKPTTLNCGNVKDSILNDF